MNAQAGMLAYLFGRSRGLGAVWRMPRCAAALGRFCLLAMHSSAHEMKTVAGTLGRSGRVCPAGGREGPSGLRCPAEAGGRCPQETAKSPFCPFRRLAWRMERAPMRCFGDCDAGAFRASSPGSLMPFPENHQAANSLNGWLPSEEASFQGRTHDLVRLQTLAFLPACGNRDVADPSARCAWVYNASDCVASGWWCHGAGGIAKGTLWTASSSASMRHFPSFLPCSWACSCGMSD